MEYTVKELIQELQKFDENLQVTIFNHEHMYNNQDVMIQVVKKEKEIQYFGLNSGLNEKFLSFS